MTDRAAQMAEEVTLNIEGQWFYRGNRSPAWIARGSAPDGSMLEISDRVPQEIWPILERVVELEARVKTLDPYGLGVVKVSEDF